MEKKRLTKTLWYGSDVDEYGNPLVPSVAPDYNHLDGLNEGELYIHNHPKNPSIFIRTSDSNIVPISGNNIKELEKLFLSKTKDDRSKGKVASDKGFEVGKFVAGASGAIIQVDAKNGQTIAEFDKLYVRMKAYFETLEIINVNSVGGKMILSPAGSVTCLDVEELEDSYRCYFLGEQDGEIIENRWKAGMQAYSQMFNAKEGVSNKVSNNYYWRLVTAVSEDVVDFNNQKCHYIDLSKSDCDTNSDIPKVGDVINHRGCRNNADYMNFIEFSSVGTNAPYITLFQGVNSYSLADKEYVSFGYDQSTGRAYMNVYGDMYFGNRDGSSYIKYNPTDGLEVKGKLSVGTTYNGSEIGSLFDKQQEDLEKFTEAVTKEFENIRNEMDGAIDTWFGEETPTLGNYPAVDWTTNADKDSHLGDLFYTNDGKAYRFQYTEDKGYHWAAIEDSEVVKALELAQKALDTADGKRRVFIEQPYTPYDLGDLWAAGESQPLMRCINARESGSYYASDWAVADDSHAYTDAVKKDLQASINATKSELDKAIEDAEAAAKDYTDEGKAVLQLAIVEMEKSKANLDDVYTKAFEDDTITKLEARALEAAQAEAKAAQALAEEASAIYADGVVTKEEEARIEQAKVNLAEAKAYAEEKANEAFNNAMEQIAGYEYLKEALKEDTSIEGGLIQSSLIKLGYTGASGYVVMAGSNGTLDSSLGDKSIAFWAGGDMLDRENGSNASNAADFLVRMDGSGYAAGGNLSWDINGKITADPMSFFVGEDTVSALLRAFTITYNSSNAPTLITPNAPFGVFNVNGASTFASTLSVNGDITANSKLLLGDIPMYKSKDGVVYIDGHLVVKGGVTMYGVDSADIPSLINSLPVASTKEKGVAYFDPDFFSVSSDGKVTFIGETGGGLDITALQNYLTQNSYLNVTEGDNRYLKLSGGTISGNYGALHIKRDDVHSSLIKYSNNSGVLGYLGFNSSKEPFVYKGTDTTTSYILWHTGNDGANSGLDADLLDGYHRNSFYSLYGGLHIDATSSNNVDLNTLTSADSYYQATSANAGYVTNKPSGVGSAFRLYVSNSNGTNSKYLRQRIQQFNSADIYERVSNNSGSTWTDWVLVQTGLSSFTASSTLDGTLSITLGSLSANVDNLYAKTTRFFANQWDYNSGTVLDLNEWDTGGIVRCYGGSDNLLNRPDGFSYGNVLSLSNGTKALTGQLAWAVNHNSKTDTTKALWFRASDSANGFTYSPWRKIAFADLFLPLTGGTLSGALLLKNDCKLVGLDTSGGEAYIAYVSQSNNVILGSVFHNAYLSGTTVNIRYGGTSGIYLDSSGNVGIGTTTPAYKLDVNGSTKVLGVIYGGNSIYSNSKTSATDGVAGCMLGDKGIYINSSANPTINFYVNNATSVTQQITASKELLSFSGKTKHNSGLESTTGVFSGALTVEGIKISKSKDDVLFIDGNVVVRGGVTMYGTNSTTAPSILDSLPIASTTTKGVAYFDSEFFSVGSDGKVSFIGKTDGFNATELQNYLTQNSYLNTTSGDNRYLKLSGGTLTYKSSPTALTIKRTASGSASWIDFYNNDGKLGAIGIGGSNSPIPNCIYFHDPSINKDLKVWHEGNDGAGSGLDADLLDGKEGSWYIRNVLNFQEVKGTNTSGGYDLNVLNYGLVKNYASSSYWANAPVGFSYGMVLNLKTSSTNSLLGQLAWDVNHNSTTDTTRSLHWRTIQNDTTTEYAKWHQIAFIDSNVASATKLETAQTIWGQSFDGTSSIKGNIYVINKDATTIVESSSKIKFNSLNTRDDLRSPYIQAIHANSYSRKRLSVFQSNAANYTDDFVEVFTILPNGRVGIGTPSPASLLDVNGDASITGQLNLPTTGSSAFSKPQILLGGGMARIGVGSTGFMGIYSKTTIRLSQDSETAASSTGIWIYTGGFVGINNSAPTHTLDVSGSLHASKNAIIDGALNVTGVSTLTGGIATNDIHGNGNALYLGNSGNTSYIYIREDMASSSDSWSIKLGGEATFGSLTSNGALTVGDSATLSSTLTVAGATTLSSTLTGNYWYLNNSASNPYLRLNRASSSSSYWYIQSVSGYISIGGAKSANSVRIDASGNILAAGGITMYSQRSLKNIQDERGLSLVELGTIKPIRYTWKDGRDNRLHIGGIADDIQQVLPEVVYKTNDGVLTMDYGNAAFAIASSLIKPVVDHEKRIAMLEEENKQLRQEVERLKSA